MKAELLDYLACPRCGDAPLALTVERADGDEIEAGTLGCRGCHTDYRISDFVPNFLPDDAQSNQWRKAWSYKWDNVAMAQRYSADGDQDFAIKINYTGFFSGDLTGKLALDAGCGSGQDSARIAKAGAVVIAVDQSTGPYHAFAFNRGQPFADRLHFIRADLFHPPLRKDLFDVVYSNGVLHHTPDTKRAFESVTGLLKVGGYLAVWVYDRTQYRRLFETFWRPVLCRWPHWLLSAFLAVINRPWYWIYRYRRFVMGRLNPWPESSVARTLLDLISGGHLLYLLTDYHLHIAVTVDDHALRHHHAFDCYSPVYAAGHDEAELFEWCKAGGLEPVALSRRRCGISAVKTGSPSRER